MKSVNIVNICETFGDSFKFLLLIFFDIDGTQKSDSSRDVKKTSVIIVDCLR